MLRDITYWVLDVLENAGLHASLTAGALLGVVRDGGVLISADTDVDIAVCPEDKDKVGTNNTSAAATSHPHRCSGASRPWFVNAAGIQGFEGSEAASACGWRRVQPEPREHQRAVRRPSLWCPSCKRGACRGVLPPEAVAVAWVSHCAFVVVLWHVWACTLCSEAFQLGAPV